MGQVDNGGIKTIQPAGTDIGFEGVEVAAGPAVLELVVELVLPQQRLAFGTVETEEVGAFDVVLDEAHDAAVLLHPVLAGRRHHLHHGRRQALRSVPYRHHVVIKKLFILRANLYAVVVVSLVLHIHFYFQNLQRGLNGTFKTCFGKNPSRSSRIST